MIILCRFLAKAARIRDKLTNFVIKLRRFRDQQTIVFTPKTERIKIMADFEELSFSYLGLLSNAHHDGTTQQILASFQ